MIRSIALLAALSMGFTTAGVAAAHSPLTARADVDMARTGVDADARGRAKMQVRGADEGRLEVQVLRRASTLGLGGLPADGGERPRPDHECQRGGQHGQHRCHHAGHAAGPDRSDTPAL